MSEYVTKDYLSEMLDSYMISSDMDSYLSEHLDSYLAGYVTNGRCAF